MTRDPTSTRRARRHLVRAWFGVAMVWTALLVTSAPGLTPPPLGGPASLEAWLRARPPLDLAFALIRLAGLGAGAYVLIVLTVASVASLLRAERGLRIAHRLAPPGVRPLIGLAAAAALAAAGPAAWAGPAGAAAPRPAPTLRWTGPAPTDRRPPATPPVLRQVGPPPTAPGKAPGAGPSPATPRTAQPPATQPPTAAPPAAGPPSVTSPEPRSPAGPGREAGGRAGVAPRPPADRGGAGPPAAGHAHPTAAPRRRHRHRRQPGQATGRTSRPSPPSGETGEHVVAPGDSFWSIATAQLRRADRPTDAGAVEAYVEVLVDANGDRLPVPGDPDLLFPGDRLRLPPPAPAGP